MRSNDFVESSDDEDENNVDRVFDRFFEADMRKKSRTNHLQQQTSTG